MKRGEPFIIKCSTEEFEKINQPTFTEEELQAMAEKTRKYVTERNALYCKDHDKAYQQGRADAIEEYRNKLTKEMHDLWRFYKADTKNRPKPSFLCASNIVELIAEQLKEQNKDNCE